MPPVVVFAKLNQTVVGYFDPVDVFPPVKMSKFWSELTNVSVKTNTLVATPAVHPFYQKCRRGHPEKIYIFSLSKKKPFRIKVSKKKSFNFENCSTAHLVAVINHEVQPHEFKAVVQVILVQDWSPQKMFLFII